MTQQEPTATTQSVAASAPTLRRDALRTLHIASTSIANMAPAYSLYTTLAVIVVSAGVGSPLLLILAGVATLFHVNSTAEFSRKIPSAGSYTVFMSRTFGRYVGGVTGWTYVFSSVLLLTSVYIVGGTWPQVSLSAAGISVPWWLPLIILAVIGIALCALGVVISTKWAIAFFLFEVAVLLIGSIGMLVTHPGSINLDPFNPAKISGGMSGLGLAFPLAVYPYLGASNAATMAEEVRNPKRAIRQAVFAAVLAAIVIYVFGTWATVVGYGEHVTPLTHAAFPIVDGSVKVLGPFGFLMYLGGLTSTMALIIVDTNAFARVWFNLAREGLLPKPMASVHPRFQTPWISVIAGGGVTLALALGMSIAFGTTNAFDWTGTLGTIPMILIFLAVNVALPVYYWMNHRSDFSVMWHVLFPLIGCVAFAFPLISTLSPNQPAPYNSFGWITGALIILGMAYMTWLVRARSERLKLGTYVVE